MKLTLYQIYLKTKKKLASFWYWLMTPIAYFFTVEKVGMRYKKNDRYGMEVDTFDMWDIGDYNLAIYDRETKLHFTDIL